MGKKDKDNPLDQATTVKKKKGLADPSSGDQFKMSEHLGSLVLIDPKEFEADFVTTAGVSDIVRGDITVLTETDGKTVLDEPTEYINSIIFGRGVVASLRGNVGSDQLVVAVIGQGVAKAGQTAPWSLDPASEKQKKVAIAHLG